MANKRKCAHCKQYFDLDDMEYVGVSSFCSQECLIEKRSKHYNETKVIVSKPRKSGPMDSNLWSSVVRRDYGRCRSCATNKRLHVHHVRYRSELGEDSIDNLIALCEPCHRLVHSNKKLYQPALIALVDQVNHANSPSFLLPIFLQE